MPTALAVSLEAGGGRGEFFVGTMKFTAQDAV